MNRLDSFVKAIGKAYLKRPKPLVILQDDTSIVLEFLETGDLLVSERSLDPDVHEEYGLCISYHDLGKVIDWLRQNVEYGR